MNGNPNGSSGGMGFVDIAKLAGIVAALETAVLAISSFLFPRIGIPPILEPWLRILYYIPLLWFLGRVMSDYKLRLISGVVLGVWLVTALWDSGRILYNGLVYDMPFTGEALEERKVYMDVKTADVARPVGTGLIIAATEHRMLREGEINKLAAEELARVRKQLTTGKDHAGKAYGIHDAERDEQRIMRWKTDNVHKLQEVKVDLKDEDKPSFFQKTWNRLKTAFANFTWEPRHLAVQGYWLLVILAIPVGIILAIAWKSHKPIIYSLVIVTLGLIVGDWVTAPPREPRSRTIAGMGRTLTPPPLPNEWQGSEKVDRVTLKESFYTHRLGEYDYLILGAGAPFEVEVNGRTRQISSGSYLYPGEEGEALTVRSYQKTVVEIWKKSRS